MPACSASSTASSASSSSSSMTSATTGSGNDTSNSAPTASSLLAVSDRRLSRRPITSRTPAGMPRSASERVSVHTPSAKRSSPSSTRCSSVSRRKNGLPSVSVASIVANASGTSCSAISLEERVHVGGAESRQRDAQWLDLALEHAEGLRERVPAIDVGLAIRAHDQQSRGAGGAADRAQHPDCGVVGPVQVVDDEEHGGAVAEPHERLAERVAQPRRSRHRPRPPPAHRHRPARRGSRAPGGRRRRRRGRGPARTRRHRRRAPSASVPRRTAT